jgi:hypothetical protein
MDGYEFSWDCDGMVYEVYGYHPNYLGSVDLVSMLSGHVHQFFTYTPWGESMYEYSAQPHWGLLTLLSGLMTTEEEAQLLTKVARAALNWTRKPAIATTARGTTKAS